MLFKAQHFSQVSSGHLQVTIILADREYLIWADCCFIFVFIFQINQISQCILTITHLKNQKPEKKTYLKFLDHMQSVV